MSEFNEPPKSGWAEFHRGCGWFLFVLGGIGFVLFLNASDRSDKGAAIQLLILGIAGGIASFFAAFLIDVFTDMRHFLAGMRKDLAELTRNKNTARASGAYADTPSLSQANGSRPPVLLTSVDHVEAPRLVLALKITTHTIAGTVVAWGDNGGFLGLFGDGRCAVPAGLGGVVAIAAGGYHTVALQQDGTVVAWGINSSGQTTVPAGLSGVVAIAAGVYHTVALKQDGTVVAWGGNCSGQTTVPAGLSGVVAIAAGWYHTVALKLDASR